MILIKRIKIRSYEIGLHFHAGEFQALLGEGVYWFFDPLLKNRVDIVSKRDPELVHDKLDVLVKADALGDRAVVLDLKDHQRALVWIDGRFSRMLPPGLYAYWTELCDVRVEVIDAHDVRFDHEDDRIITRSKDAAQLLDIFTVTRDSAGVLYIDGEYVDTLTPGRYAFWRDAADTKVVAIDLRETMTDVNGQDIMTSVAERYL